MEESSGILDRIYEVIEDRKTSPSEKSYIATLLVKGKGNILDKVVEETGELIAGVLNEDRDGIIHEVADLWFHFLVLLGSLDIPSREIYDELQNRWDRPGLEEKESRHKPGA
jgi:phosphoribosyl-ATP pyrophosphohydrolase